MKTQPSTPWAKSEQPKHQPLYEGTAADPELSAGRQRVQVGHGVEVSRQGQQGVLCAAILRAIQRLRPVRVDAFYRHLDRFHVVVVALQSELDDGVQRHVKVGNLLRRGFEEVAQDAAQHGLVGDGEDVGLTLELSEDGYQTVHDVYVGLALGVAVLELLAVTQGQLARETFLQLLVGEALAFTLEKR